MAKHHKSWILSIYLTEEQDNINSRFIWELVFSLKSINNLCLFLANDQSTWPGVPSCAQTMHMMAPSALIHCILACGIALACAAPCGAAWGLKCRTLCAFCFWFISLKLWGRQNSESSISKTHCLFSMNAGLNARVASRNG